MFRTITLLPALGALALGGAAHAQAAADTTTATPPPAETKLVARKDVPLSARMAMHVNAHALEELMAAVPEGEIHRPLFLRLALIAKQEASAISCDDWQLDGQRMMSTVLRSFAPLYEGEQEEGPNPKVNAALRTYHLMLGGELAQFAHDPSAYCAYANELVADLTEEKTEEADSMLVIKPAG